MNVDCRVVSVVIMSNDPESAKREYINLLELVKILPAENLAVGINQAQQIISQEISLHNSQYNSVLDARLSSCTTKAVVTLTSNASNEINTYDKDVFARHVASNPMFWHFPFPKEVPVISYLYGTFEPSLPEPKKRAPRKVVNKQIAGSARALAKLANIQNNTKENPEAASKIYQFLQEQTENGSCSYFHLVLNPTSFSKTVENIYNVACLVRDNLVTIYIHRESGLPYVKYLPVKKGESVNTNRKHFIESIDMQRWRDMVEALQIRRPLLSFNDSVIEDNHDDDDNGGNYDNDMSS